MPLGRCLRLAHTQFASAAADDDVRRCPPFLAHRSLLAAQTFLLMIKAESLENVQRLRMDIESCRFCLTARSRPVRARSPPPPLLRASAARSAVHSSPRTPPPPPPTRR